jgi:hypothetical protein
VWWLWLADASSTAAARGVLGCWVKVKFADFQQVTRSRSFSTLVPAQ